MIKVPHAGYEAKDRLSVWNQDLSVVLLLTEESGRTKRKAPSNSCLGFQFNEAGCLGRQEDTCSKVQRTEPALSCGLDSRVLSLCRHIKTDSWLTVLEVEMELKNRTESEEMRRERDQGRQRRLEEQGRRQREGDRRKWQCPSNQNESLSENKQIKNV